MSSKRSIEVSLSPGDERQVVHGGDARAWVAELLCGLEARLQLSPGLGMVALTRGQDPEKIVRLSQRGGVPGHFGQAQGRPSELESLSPVTTPVLVQTSVGLDPSGERRVIPSGPRSGLEAAGGDLPVASTLVNAPELVLDAGESRACGRHRRRRLEALHGPSVLALQGLELADRLVQLRLVGVTEGQRRLEVRDRLGIREERPGVLARETVVVSRFGILPGEAIVIGDEARARAWVSPDLGGERLRGAPMEQPASSEARVRIDDVAELVVHEAVALLGLDQQDRAA